jgi:hypothetical protein
MAKDLVLQLRYIGMLPHIGHREYRFQIEAHDKSVRTVTLTIDDGIFRKNQLMFQEAPDLCYQKLLADVINETAGTPICSRTPITDSEIATYRNSHPTGKMRRMAPRQPSR